MDIDNTFLFAATGLSCCLPAKGEILGVIFTIYFNFTHIYFTRKILHGALQVDPKTERYEPESIGGSNDLHLTSTSTVFPLSFQHYIQFSALDFDS